MNRFPEKVVPMTTETRSTREQEIRRRFEVSYAGDPYPFADVSWLLERIDALTELVRFADERLAASKAKAEALTQALKDVREQLRSGAHLSRQLGTPAADAECLDGWADMLDAALRGER